MPASKLRAIIEKEFGGPVWGLHQAGPGQPRARGVRGEGRGEGECRPLKFLRPIQAASVRSDKEKAPTKLTRALLDPRPLHSHAQSPSRASHPLLQGAPLEIRVAPPPAPGHRPGRYLSRPGLRQAAHSRQPRGRGRRRPPGNRAGRNPCATFRISVLVIRVLRMLHPRNARHGKGDEIGER